MILLDVNLVLALHVRTHQHHTVVRQWLNGIQVDGEDFGAPTSVWHSYLRLVTNPKVTSPSASIAAAFAFIASIRAQPGYQEIEPGRRHLAVLERVCVAADVRADLVNDASLAAIAIEHGATVASFDRDFARFPGLRWIVPDE